MWGNYSKGRFFRVLGQKPPGKRGNRGSGGPIRQVCYGILIGIRLCAGRNGSEGPQKGKKGACRPFHGASRRGGGKKGPGVHNPKRPSKSPVKRPKIAFSRGGTAKFGPKGQSSAIVALPIWRAYLLCVSIEFTQDLGLGIPSLFGLIRC